MLLGLKSVLTKLVCLRYHSLFNGCFKNFFPTKTSPPTHTHIHIDEGTLLYWIIGSASAAFVCLFLISIYLLLVRRFRHHQAGSSPISSKIYQKNLQPVDRVESSLLLLPQVRVVVQVQMVCCRP